MYLEVALNHFWKLAARSDSATVGDFGGNSVRDIASKPKEIGSAKPRFNVDVYYAKKKKPLASTRLLQGSFLEEGLF